MDHHFSNFLAIITPNQHVWWG